MTFVAEGLGVTLAREHIKRLPHPGVAFRPLAPPVKSDYCIAWNRNNDSRALQQYVEIVKGLAADVHWAGTAQPVDLVPARPAIALRRK